MDRRGYVTLGPGNGEARSVAPTDNGRLAAATWAPWRAKRKPPDLLPHHPLVLHRGGYPDGS